MTAEEYVPQAGEYVVTANSGRWFVLKDLDGWAQMAADDAANNPMRSIYFRFAAAIVRIDGEEVEPAEFAPALEARIDLLSGDEINALERAYDERADPSKRPAPKVDYAAAPNELVVPAPTGRWFVLRTLTARQQMAADEVAGFGARQTYYRTAMRVARINGTEVPLPTCKEHLDERIRGLMGEECDALGIAYNQRFSATANLKNV